jgi:predicted RNA-binding Zn-ribbon protein involved in translation (DUF1610 family)
LTAIIVFITLASVVILAVLFVVLGAAGKGKSRSSSSSSSSSSSHSKISSSSNRSSSGRGSIPDIGINPVFLGGSTRTVTREVVREVPVIKKPESIQCPYCGRAYVPAENKYACPNCGGATTDELRKQSEEG